MLDWDGKPQTIKQTNINIYRSSNSVIIVFIFLVELWGRGIKPTCEFNQYLICKSTALCLMHSLLSITFLRKKVTNPQSQRLFLHWLFYLSFNFYDFSLDTGIECIHFLS